MEEKINTITFVDDTVAENLSLNEEETHEQIEEKLYTITLADGTVIENLRLNGTNYISDIEVSADIFANNCSPLIISDGENEEIHEHAELVQIAHYDFVDGWWIAFRDIPAKELEEREKEQRIEDLEAVLAEILGGGEI